MYQQFRSWITGITTYRTEDTTAHNLIHAMSIRVVHLSPSCLTRFPDCVGLVPNSTATTLRTVKASGTGSSSRSTGHSGLGTNSAHMQFFCHYTSYLNFWYQHISVSSPVTYLHRSPLGFYFISRLEDDQLKLPCTSCNRWFSFVRIFPSHLVILFSYSARLLRNSLSGSQLRGHIHPVPLRLSFFVSQFDSKHFSCHIYPPPHRDPVLRPMWTCHPLTSLALLPHQSDGFVGASYTDVSGAAAIVYC